MSSLNCTIILCDPATRGDRQTQKISQLQGTLKVADGHMKDAETRAAQAEDDARQKDKEMNEAFEKIQKMEAVSCCCSLFHHNIIFKTE